MEDKKLQPLRLLVLLGLVIYFGFLFSQSKTEPEPPVMQTPHLHLPSR